MNMIFWNGLKNCQNKKRKLTVDLKIKPHPQYGSVKSRSYLLTFMPKIILGVVLQPPLIPLLFRIYLQHP
jgi:hypothetical protein